MGRILITLGIINGGLGLLFSGDDTRGESIAYGVIAAVIWLTYIGIVLFASFRKPVPHINGKEKPSGA